jgi:hypothetical protein
MKRTALAILLGLAAAVAAFPQARPAPRAASRSGIAIGDLVWTDGEVLRAEPPDKKSWKKVAVGDKLRTGDTLRTTEAAVARIEFPWMKLTLAPASMVSIPASAVLSMVLDQGRAEFSGPGRDIVKIEVGEGEVRGGGRVVLRRSVGRTSVTALDGAFRVRGAGRIVEIKKGQGTFVLDGRPPEPARAIPPPPKGLRPGADVSYVRSGQPVELSWIASGASHHVELLALQGDDDVLLARDVAASPLRLSVPWLGTYRWRVSTRDARDVESPPSADGLICSVER